MKPVVVLGAGISGLCVALRLKKRGVPVVVLEASDRVGGALRTETEHGFQFECGPHSVFDREPAMLALIEEVALSGRLVFAGPEARVRFLCRHGKLRKVPPGAGLLTSDLLSLRARLRILGELASPRSHSDDDTVLEFGKRHIGEEATRMLVDPLVSFLFAGDISRLSMKSCFPALHALGGVHRSLAWGLLEEYRAAKRAGPWLPVAGNMLSFVGGLEELPAAVAAQLGNAIRLRARAVELKIERDEVRVTIEGSEPLDASAVVLAVPAHDGARLLQSSLPQAAALMREISYSPLALVHLGYSRASLSADLAASGFFVPASEELPVLGCLFASSIFPGRAPSGQTLLTVLIGGSRRPDLANLNPDELECIARRQLELLLGTRGEPSFARVTRWPRAIPQYLVGTERRNSQLRQILDRVGRIQLAGNAYHGVSVNDCVRRSGEIAAEVIARTEQA
jgi:oxygen-dependent protoporphyrinogen oxidase